MMSHSKLAGYNGHQATHLFPGCPLPAHLIPSEASPCPSTWWRGYLLRLAHYLTSLKYSVWGWSSRYLARSWVFCHVSRYCSCPSEPMDSDANTTSYCGHSTVLSPAGQWLGYGTRSPCCSHAALSCSTLLSLVICLWMCPLSTVKTISFCVFSVHFPQQLVKAAPG